MDTKLEIENEYVRILELTRRANKMSQNITSEDVEFKPILRIPKAYLTQLHKEKDSTEEDIVGVLQRSGGSESETVMTVAEFETKLEAIERMSSTSSGEMDTIDANIRSLGDPFFNMQQHMLIGVASVPLNCIKSSAGDLEWDLPIVSPSGLMSGKLTVSLQLLYVNSSDGQDSTKSGDNDDSSVDISLGSQICLKVDILHVKDLPAFYGNFLFGQYDLFGQSQPTVFYSEDQSDLQPADNQSDISVEFNHCQVHTADVTKEVLGSIDHGYFVIELWGHQAAAFNQPDDVDDKASRYHNHIQLWVQVLEKTNEETVDYQPALVEEDRITNTGGIFVLSKAKKKRLRVQAVSPSRRIRCLNITLLGVTEFSKEPVTNYQWGVQPYQNIISSAWAQSVDQYEENACKKKPLERKISHPHMLPFSQSIRRKKVSSKAFATSHTPDPKRNPRLEKRSSFSQKQKVHEVPFLERETSYPEDSAFSVHNISQTTLKSLKCKKNNEAIAEWDQVTDVDASCADNWYLDVIVKTTLQTSYYKTMEFILRKRICVKILDDKQVDNYTSFITGYAGRKIGTKCGALFDISPKDTKHKTIDRRDSMAYIEVFKGEDPEAVLMGRLQHISQLHQQRRRSTPCVENGLSASDLARLEKLAQDNSGQSTPHGHLSRQERINKEPLVEVNHEQEEENDVDDKGDQHVLKKNDEIDIVDDINSNTNNNNFNSVAIGERVVVQIKARYLFGYVRFIGQVPFSDKEQIGIELDQACGKLDGTVNGVLYFKCKPEHGIFTTRDKIITNPLKL